MSKAPDAFRTISEVSEILDTPAHVLRFWESRFTQVSPIKRAGGRRYYRPADLALLGGIKRLLHDDGMTIRGVQKLLKDQGARHVAALADPSLLAANAGEAPQPAPQPDTPAPDVAPQTPAPTAPADDDLAATAPDPVAALVAGIVAAPGGQDPETTAAEPEGQDPALQHSIPENSGPPPETETDAGPAQPEQADPAMAQAPAPDLATLAAWLRRLPPEAADTHHAALAELRARLVTLHARRAQTLVAGRG